MSICIQPPTPLQAGSSDKAAAAGAESAVVTGPAAAPGKSSAATAAWLASAAGMGMGMGGAGGGDTLNLAGLLNVSMVLMYVIAVCGMVPGG